MWTRCTKHKFGGQKVPRVHVTLFSTVYAVVMLHEEPLKSLLCFLFSIALMSKDGQHLGSVFFVVYLSSLKPNFPQDYYFVLHSTDCWDVSLTLRSSVPQACSPQTLSLSRGCWKTRPLPEAVQEKASVPH